ncbi:MAG TPA: hypothetical protein VM915_04545, partial [Verrucomicrobiae bacterium]|nr:hypothetical protein [Verrucomicrobiae bacterium]
MTQTIPPSASAQDLIAQGFAALGREAYEEAAQFARAGLARAPGDPGAMTLLGRLAMAASRPDVALEIFTNLAQPGAPAVIWLDLARAQLDLRREERALETAQYAVELAPGSAAGWFLIGEIATMLNRMEDAVHALRRVLELAPNDTDAFPRLCRIASVTDDEVAQAERKLAIPRLAPVHAANLHYGLASVYKRRKEPKKYIAHLLGANAAQRAAFTGVLPDLKAANERLVSIFSKEAFARAAQAIPMQPTPIFIIGMP